MSEGTDKLPREARVDQIGFVNELAKLHADKLKDQVKARMQGEDIERVEGDVFEGLLVKGETRTIDPVKFHRLLDKGEIKQAEFLSCIRVDRRKAEEFVAGKDLDRISSMEPTVSLRVSRKKGVVITLVEVVRNLAKEIVG